MRAKLAVALAAAAVLCLSGCTQVVAGQAVGLGASSSAAGSQVDGTAAARASCQSVAAAFAIMRTAPHMPAGWERGTAETALARFHSSVSVAAAVVRVDRGTPQGVADAVAEYQRDMNALAAATTPGAAPIDVARAAAAVDATATRVREACR